MKKSLLLTLFLLPLALLQAQTVSDIDGNVYNTITIGSQIWMQENLKVTHFRDGSIIPNIKDSVEWANFPIEAYCNYNNDSNIASVYGNLYNWNAVFQSKICPMGWHIPTNYDWDTLAIFLGGDTIAGGKMKETGISHWQNPNIGATNISGFLALPGGMRNQETFTSTGFSGYWWTRTQSGNNSALFRSINNDQKNLFINSNIITTGLSARCICDTSANGIKELNIINDFNLSPNPATTTLNLQFPQLSKKAEVYIYDMQARLLLQKEIKKVEEETDVSGLAKGLYIVRVRDEKNIAVTKFIKE